MDRLPDAVAGDLVALTAVSVQPELGLPQPKLPRSDRLRTHGGADHGLQLSIIDCRGNAHQFARGRHNIILQKRREHLSRFYRVTRGESGGRSFGRSFVTRGVSFARTPETW